MLGSSIIEVGIGMSFLFLFMSLIASSLCELIESFTKTRARDLERAIAEIVGPEGRPERMRALYEHPLVAALYRGTYAAGSRELPSYIPREIFSRAALDIVAGTSVSGGKLSLAALRGALDGPGSDNPVRRAVLTALDEAGGDLAKIRSALEVWYDGVMDRASGWYTRRAGWILGGIGLGAAAFFNVDAITVASRLMMDRDLRASLVAQAGTAPDPGTEAQRFTNLQSRFAEIGFPIGWRLTDGGLYPEPQACKVPEVPGAEPICTWTTAAVPMVFGWFITALAIMLGAPFWFDVLNKFTVIRSTVKPKEKSPDEAA